MSNQPVTPLPQNSPTLFYSQMLQYMRDELPAILYRYFPQGFLRLGGIHGVSSSTITEAFSTEAFTNAGNHVGEYAAINYSDPNLGVNVSDDTCWVIISSLEVPTIPFTNFQRVGQSHYYVDAASTTEPALPTDSYPLMQVTLQNSTISAVIPFRNTYASPVSAALGIINVADYALSGDGSGLRPYLGWERVFLAMPNRHYHFSAGYFATSLVISITQDYTQISGEGTRITNISYVPTGDQGAGVFNFQKPNNQNIVDCSLRDLSIVTADTSFQKVGLKIVNGSNIKVDNISIGASGLWTGNQSRGIWTNGRDSCTFSRIDISADVPIDIGKNPFDSADITAFVFRDTKLQQTAINGPYPCVRLTGVNLSNVRFEGYNNWSNGAHGLLWQDSSGLATQPSVGLYLNNVRWDFSLNAGGYIVDIEGTTQPIYTVVCDGCVNAVTNNVLGYKFHLTRNVVLRNTFYGGTFGLSYDGTNQGLTFDNCFWQTGAVASIGTEVVSLFGFQNNSFVGPLLTHGAFGIKSSVNQMLSVNGMKFWQDSGTVLNGVQTPVLYPFIINDVQIATIIVSFVGTTLFGGGHAIAYRTTPGIQRISGTTNFDVGSVAGKFTILTQAQQIALLNNTGETMLYTVQVFKA